MTVIPTELIYVKCANAACGQEIPFLKGKHAPPVKTYCEYCCNDVPSQSKKEVVQMASKIKWKRSEGASRMGPMVFGSIEEGIQHFADGSHSAEDIMFLLELSDENQVIDYCNENKLFLTEDSGGEDDPEMQD